MAKLKLWSTTPGDNNATPPLGWPEGMAPSNVNNTARQDRASIREWYEDAEWIDYGHTIFSVVGQVITFTGDLTAIYAVGRTLRQDGTSIGLITGVSLPGGNTAVTVSGFTPAAVPVSIEAGITYNSVARLVSGTSKIEALTSSGAIAISTAGAERVRVDASGRVLIGTTAAQTASDGGITPIVQANATDANGSSSMVSRFAVAAATSPTLVLAKSAAAAVGTFTAVATGHYLGTIRFEGADGTDFSTGAQIRADVNGTVGAGDVPSDLAFFTKPAGGALAERMRILTTGFVGIGITTPTALGSGGSPVVLQLHSTGTGTTSFGNMVLSSAATGNNSLMGAIAFGSTGLSGADKRTAQITSNKLDALTVNPIGNLVFQTANGGVPATRLTIDASGNTTPGADGTQSFGASGAEWSAVFTRGLQRVSAGDLQINSSNAAGTISFRAAGADRLTIASTGAVTVAAPSSGYGLTVNGGVTAGNFPGNFVSTNTSTTQNSGTVIRIASSASGADAHIAFTDGVTVNSYIGVAGITTAAEMYFAIDGDSAPQKRFAIGAGGNVDVIGGAFNTTVGADIASAATVNLDTATGNVVNITGSVGISAITLTNGRTRLVRFTGAPLLTNGASLVILPGAANYQVVAGDMATITAIGGVKYVLIRPVGASFIPATQADQELSTSLVVAVTPGRQHFHPSALKAYVQFNGTGVLAVNVSYNVTSVTDNGVGDYTVNFNTAFSTANYTMAGSAAVGQPAYASVVQDTATTPTTTAFRIAVLTQSGGNPTKTDLTRVCTQFFGDH